MRVERFSYVFNLNMRNFLESLKNRLSFATPSSIPSEYENPPSYQETNPYQRRRHSQVDHHNSPSHYTASKIDHEIVGKTFYKLLFPMQWIGLFPAKIKDAGKFYSRPTLRIILFTAANSVAIISCVTVYTLNRALDIDWPFRLWAPLKPQEIYDSTSGKRAPPNFFIWVTLALQIIIPISSLVYGHLSLYHFSGYCSFLNQWTEYSKLFEIYFSPYSYSISFTDLPKYRNRYASVYFPAILATLVIVPYMSTTKVLQTVDGSFIGLSTLTTLFWVETLIIIRVVFSIKDCLNLHVLEISYRELRKGVEAQYTVLQGKVNRLHVRNWLKMVVLIRDQRTLLEQHIGVQNNYMLVEIFGIALLVLTASIVVIMNDIDEYFGWVTTYVGISVAFIFFLFFKAELAEGISEQEELLAESIVAMTDYDNCDTRLEMKSLCDLIFHDPIKITLGYVFVLNKRLMLAFCSQLAASLVILLQFVNH